MTATMTAQNNGSHVMQAEPPQASTPPARNIVRVAEEYERAAACVVAKLEPATEAAFQFSLAKQTLETLTAELAGLMPKATTASRQSDPAKPRKQRTRTPLTGVRPAVAAVFQRGTTMTTSKIIEAVANRMHKTKGRVRGAVGVALSEGAEYTRVGLGIWKRS